ncbi:hypothetical protein ACWDRR_22675 [Kitasatospora sp. NPDC003701]
MELDQLPNPIREALQRLLTARVISGYGERGPNSWVVGFTNGYHLGISSPNPAGVWFDRQATAWWAIQGAGGCLPMGYERVFPSHVGIPVGHSTPDSIAVDLDTVAEYPPHLGALLAPCQPLEDWLPTLRNQPAPG